MAETHIVQANVIETFASADAIPASGPIPLFHLSTDKDRLLFDWLQQWKPLRDKASGQTLKKMWDWASQAEQVKKEKVGWYAGQNLIALANIKICTSADNPRFKIPSVALYLFERSQKAESFKGMARPFFYETARQIGIVKGVPNMSVIGGYHATDQDDFDLFFGMESDSPNILPLKDCDFRTRKCETPFDWAHLPTYFEMQREKKLGAVPTPAI